jgi:phosphoribosyl-ATP pyrophosphohydrolase/phosphoribosyl-AMP cyclohydrolase
VVCHTVISVVLEKRYQRFSHVKSIINQRIDENVEGSYTSKLYQRGINKVAQK